ncbi:glycosyltransferase family 4 protein [Psychrobacter sp. APC 3281]|uniref:glycosyltransferase family 4 protein n=1 Tax=Psychrobacter sp. APC 3281 TaxID=3035190 RepID=UPI0025B31E62|nr:glycosyltransferase family 4 protein [Psychrobacter sp. APC 3281]MDN3448461.1 glycosyltransferase family 4 protein [Psychrobacter sp. APC 3281]
MKILILGGKFNNTGGTERVGSMLANGLSKEGYEIVLASISCGDKPFFPINKGIKIVSLFNTPGRALYRTPNIIYKIRKLLKEERIDTLIVVETMSVLFTLPATLGLPINHICWEHFNFNTDLGKKGRRIARQLAARYCDSVVTLTERDKQYWLKGTRHNSQITAIANPCPFPVQENTKENNTKIVLAIGRLTHQKGFDLLLESWFEINKLMSDWKLKIVGEGIDRQKLAEFIEQYELTNSVELVDSTNDVSKYYKEAEIFCLSSRFEGFGMVLIEALAFGLPIVSFDCEVGPAEILEDTGSILVPPNDISELALSLIDLMQDDERRKIISIKSKEKAKLYQPEVIMSQWVNLLESFE